METVAENLQDEGMKIMLIPVNRENFIQICIVVDDIETAVEKWAELFGIPKPEVHARHLEGSADYSYRGKPVSCDLKVADIDMGKFIIELHQPVGGDSTFQEFIDRHGNGVHHIGFEVGEKRDAIIKELEGDDYEMRTIGVYPGSSWTIVDSEDTLGVNLNIKPVR